MSNLFLQGSLVLASFSKVNLVLFFFTLLLALLISIILFKIKGLKVKNYSNGLAALCSINSIFICVFWQIGCLICGRFFINFVRFFCLLVLSNCAIIGLYVALFKIFNKKRALKLGLAFTKLTKLAKIDEEPSLCYNPIKITTQKLGDTKPRYDQNINFWRVENYISNLKQLKLSPIDSSTLLICQNKLKHYKNTLFSDESVKELNYVFMTIIKLYSKYM